MNISKFLYLNQFIRLSCTRAQAGSAAIFRVRLGRRVREAKHRGRIGLGRGRAYNLVEAINKDHPMSVGLIALLDDVAAIAKAAAASLDDVAGQAAKAGAKSAGVVIDDAAVTPRYVVGLAAARELPIVAKIARGSLFNKLVILLPAALALAAFAPWAITPLLMLGGAYLCYEGAEKVFEAVFPHKAHAHEAAAVGAPVDPDGARERQGRGRDPDRLHPVGRDHGHRAGGDPRRRVLDAGGDPRDGRRRDHRAGLRRRRADREGRRRRPRAGGRTRGAAWSRAVRARAGAGMPVFLRLLSIVGTAAMIWVGGGIVLHGLEAFGWGALPHAIHDVAHVVGPGVAGGAGRGRMDRQRGRQRAVRAGARARADPGRRLRARAGRARPDAGEGVRGDAALRYGRASHDVTQVNILISLDL